MNINESLQELMSVGGSMAAAIVDGNSGMTLGSVGNGIDLDVAAAGNSEVVRSKLQTMKALKLQDSIEDILITLGKQYHIIRPLQKNEGMFLYFVLAKDRANLALARHKASEVESGLHI